MTIRRGSGSQRSSAPTQPKVSLTPTLNPAALPLQAPGEPRHTPRVPGLVPTTAGRPLARERRPVTPDPGAPTRGP